MSASGRFLPVGILSSDRPLDSALADRLIPLLLEKSVDIRLSRKCKCVRAVNVMGPTYERRQQLQVAVAAVQKFSTNRKNISDYRS
jgi:hypothetical protein